MSILENAPDADRQRQERSKYLQHVVEEQVRKWTSPMHDDRIRFGIICPECKSTLEPNALEDENCYYCNLPNYYVKHPDIYKHMKAHCTTSTSELCDDVIKVLDELLVAKESKVTVTDEFTAGLYGVADIEPRKMGEEVARRLTGMSAMFCELFLRDDAKNADILIVKTKLRELLGRTDAINLPSLSGTPVAIEATPVYDPSTGER